MAKKKFYVVWHGRKTGIFETWDECNAQINGFPGGKYKSFKTLQLAEEAFKGNYSEYAGKEIFETTLSPEQLLLLGDPILESISVDAAWNTASGEVEYQGVHTSTKKLLFKMGPFQDGTNNIVEFLAIVHGLAYCKQNQLLLPIYSDSKTAISWVRDKQANTSHSPSKENEKLFELVKRAEIWLGNNTYPNQILKWETKAWGEIPADFGRK